jgi:hypothetical protein
MRTPPKLSLTAPFQQFLNQETYDDGGVQDIRGMDMSKLVAAGLLLSLASGAYAQDAVYWPAAAPNTASSRYLNFPAGTPVSLVTRNDISTKDAYVGERVYLSVAENMMYNGQIVLPAGAPVVAEVAQSDRNGHFGVKGKLAINLLYVQTPMGPVQLSGAAARTGRSGTALSVATFALVSMVGGFLIHGTSAKIPYGTPVRAYLAQPLKFWGQQQQVATAAPAGIDVQPTQVASISH